MNSKNELTQQVLVSQLVALSVSVRALATPFQYERTGLQSLAFLIDGASMQAVSKKRDNFCSTEGGQLLFLSSWRRVAVGRFVRRNI